MPSFVKESARSIRERFESASKENPRHGARLFAEKFVERLGLTDANGSHYVSEKTGAPTLSVDRKMNTSSISIAELTEGLIGENAARKLGYATPGNEMPGPSFYKEEDSSGVGPGTLPNITAWKVAVAGLLAAKSLEAYEDPQFVLRTLPQVETVPQGNPPTWRLHDIVPTGQPAPKFDPQRGHPASDLNSLWLQTTPMDVYGLQIQVSKLTAFHDITGGKVMARAGENGTRVAMAEEFAAGYVMTALVDNTFNLGRTLDTLPTAFGTFSSSAPVGNFNSPGQTVSGTVLYQNDFVNPMVDFESLIVPRNAFNAMYHPINAALPINVMPRVVLVPPQLTPTAKFMLASKVQQRNAPAGTTKTNLTNYEVDNPYASMASEGVVESRYLDVIHRAPVGTTDQIKGLALTGQALNRWYIGDPKKAFRKLVGWEMQTYQFPESNSPFTANHLLELSQFNNAYFVYICTSPYHWVRCKGA